MYTQRYLGLQAFLMEMFVLYGRSRSRWRVSKALSPLQVGSYFSYLLHRGGYINETAMFMEEHPDTFAPLKDSLVRIYRRSGHVMYATLSNGKEMVLPWRKS